MLLNILINRLRVIRFSSGKVTKKKKLAFLSEMANLGYLIDNPEAYNDSVLDNYKSIISTLKKMKGGNVKYVPLFTGFPNDVPDEDSYFVKRIIGILGNCIGLFDEGTKLDNGLIVPDWLFDLKEFGADPITQFQDEDLFKKGIKNQSKRKKDAHTEWVHLKLVEAEEAEKCAIKYLQNILYSKSSIKESLKEDVEELLSIFGVRNINVSKVVFKEIRTYLTKYFWDKKDYESVRKFIGTSTDLLRLFAALTESDVSLFSKIKFPKFNRGQRKFVLSCIDAMPNSVVEDMNTYKGLWLKVGRGLHPGEYIVKYARAFNTFEALRNKKIVTYNSKVESAIESKDIDSLLKLLVKKPGVFARKLHHVLEVADKRSTIVLNRFKSIANRVELKNLLVMESYFETIEESDYRTIINKNGRIRVTPNTKNRVRENVIKKLLGILSEAISKKISLEKELWKDKNIWIDDVLANYTIPLQQRKASDGLISIGRGSRMPLDDSKVLRLFVYWKEKDRRTDLDLSLIKYNEDMEYNGHVSYTNLASVGIVHSGDITSALYGAAEFIDINLQTLKKKNKNTRYIASQIYVYCGDTFANIDCHAGWMIRDKVTKSYKSFDIKTVQNKFDLNGTSRYAIPVIVDLKENEIIFIDLYVGNVEGNRYNRVEGACDDISIISREMVKMNKTRPNMHSLAHYNAIGRSGNIVEDKEHADITIGVSDCDYNVGEIDKILEELI